MCMAMGCIHRRVFLNFKFDFTTLQVHDFGMNYIPSFDTLYSLHAVTFLFSDLTTISSHVHPHVYT